MALSKEARIKIFIGIDLAFFLLEITVGYYAHSLALVADAFHMLNDVISLCVGLWAVRVATTKGSSNEMTYGWARAEVLGGLVNGVFLVALCLSIFIQAIERFFEPQEVSKPQLVLAVGAVGLVFNILGLFVFHQHSHDHGHDHDHSKPDELNAAESGHAHDLAHENGAGHKHSNEASTDSGSSGATKVSGITWNIPTKPQNGDASSRGRLDRLSISSARRAGSISSRIEDLPISPQVYRDDFKNKARMQGEDPDEDSESVVDEENERETALSQAQSGQHPTEETPLINHSTHQHNKDRKKIKTGGHNHADMNIRGMFLHFLGDALGNVGVMLTALVIWFAAPWKPRFYFDPAISLIITAIILKTAIPLCVETAKPLLQAVPEDISVEKVLEDIRSLPGIKKCEHLHIWALTPMIRMATLNVEMDFNYDPKRYTNLVKEIKTCLHAYGIHNSTVQPQFSNTPPSASLECGDGQEPDLKCCTPMNGNSGTNSPDGHSGHDHT